MRQHFALLLGWIRRPVLWHWIAWVVACAGATVAAQQWPTDNGLAIWVRSRGEDRGMRMLEKHFGGDAFVIVRVQGFGDDPSGFVQGLGARLERLPTVSRVVDPLDQLDIERLEEGQQPPIVSALQLVGDDRLDFVLVIASGSSAAERAGLARELATIEAEAEQGELRFHAAGHPLVATALDAEAARVERTFIPILVALATLTIAFLLRSVLLAVATVLPAVLASSGSRAALMFLGVPSNMILVALGPLTFVLVLAATLQLVFAYRRHVTRLSPREAARAARREKWPAAFLAALTTAAGFGVFLFSPLGPVADLGVTVALTTLVVVPLAYLGLPALFASISLHTPAGRPKAGRVLRRLAVGARRRRAACVTLGVATLVCGGSALASLPRETNALTFFTDDHPLRRAFAAIEADGGGLSTIEVLVEGQKAWEDPEALRALLAGTDGVGGVFGPEDVRREIATKEVSALLRDSIETMALRAAGRLDESGHWRRWTVRFPTVGAEEASLLVERIERTVKDWSAAAGAAQPASWYVTGTLPALLEVQGALVSTLLTSLTLTLFVTLAAFFFVCRGPLEMGIALLVNLFPVGVAFSAAWVLNIPMDAATVMVAAVVLGLAVDNTFHLMHVAHRFGDRIGGRTVRGRLAAFAFVGPPAVASAAALTLGFGCLALSGFAPTARFGLLTAVGAAGSLAGDLLLLPALWLRSKSRV